MTLLELIDRIFARPPLSWFVEVNHWLTDLITTPSRRREARELREIADLTDGVIDPALVQTLRDTADRKFPSREATQ